MNTGRNHGEKENNVPLVGTDPFKNSLEIMTSENSLGPGLGTDWDNYKIIMKFRTVLAIVAIIGNLLFVALGIHLMLNYHRWKALELSPEIRLKYGEEFLHLMCYEVLPVCIVLMGSSAFIILGLLRKK